MLWHDKVTFYNDSGNNRNSRENFDANEDTNQYSEIESPKRGNRITFDTNLEDSSVNRNLLMPKESDILLLSRESEYKDQYVTKMDNLCKLIAINYDNDVSNAEESKQDAELIRASYLNSIEQMRDMLSQLEKQIKSN